MPDPAPDRYTINTSSAIRERFDEDRAWAKAVGLTAELTAAVREIIFRLEVEPNEWGESREWLDVLQIQLRCGTSRMVTVLYGVDQRHRTVWIKELRVNRRYRPRPGGA